MKFIESTGFSKRVYDYLDDDEYSRLQWAMLGRPEAGAVIPNSGGIRKLRWAAAEQGKRWVTCFVLLAARRVRNLATGDLCEERDWQSIASHIAGATKRD
jgi:hypothetical protein